MNFSEQIRNKARSFALPFAFLGMTMLFAESCGKKEVSIPKEQWENLSDDQKVRLAETAEKQGLKLHVEDIGGDVYIVIVNGDNNTVTLNCCTKDKKKKKNQKPAKKKQKRQQKNKKESKSEQSAPADTQSGQEEEPEVETATEITTDTVVVREVVEYQGERYAVINNHYHRIIVRDNYPFIAPQSTPIMPSMVTPIHIIIPIAVPVFVPQQDQNDNDNSNGNGNDYKQPNPISGPGSLDPSTCDQRGMHSAQRTSGSMRSDPAGSGEHRSSRSLKGNNAKPAHSTTPERKKPADGKYEKRVRLSNGQVRRVQWDKEKGLYRYRDSEGRTKYVRIDKGSNGSDRRQPETATRKRTTVKYGSSTRARGGKPVRQQPAAPQKRTVMPRQKQRTAVPRVQGRPAQSHRNYNSAPRSRSYRPRQYNRQQVSPRRPSTPARRHH